MRLLLSKGELCDRLGLVSARSGRRYYQTLHTKFFTDEILQNLGITREQYRRTRVFNAAQSKKLVQMFKIGEGQAPA